MLTEGEAGRRATDEMIRVLSEIRNAALDATVPNQAAAANSALVTQTTALRSLASRFPTPFDAMLRQIAAEFEGSAASAALSQLGKAMADEVIRDCNQIAMNRYPFTAPATVRFRWQISLSCSPQRCLRPVLHAASGQPRRPLWLTVDLAGRRSGCPRFLGRDPARVPAGRRDTRGFFLDRRDNAGCDVLGHPSDADG